MRCAVMMALLMTLSACASRSGDRAAPALTADPRAVTIADGRGDAAGWDAMVNDAASADVVVIGEMHGHPLGLAVAAALWDDILARSGGRPALSMEFFERDEQVDLDDYLAGLTDEATFRERTGRTDGNYPPGHRSMVEAAKQADVPVYAANSPRRYTRLARTEGYERLGELRESQRRLFVMPDVLPSGPYRDRFFDLFREMMEGHSEGEVDKVEQDERITAFFRAQSVWDATMADTIIRAIDEGHAPLVHVVGQFHSDHDGGLVQAVRTARPGARVLTVSMSDGDVFTEEDGGRADYVVPVGPAPE